LFGLVNQPTSSCPTSLSFFPPLPLGPSLREAGDTNPGPASERHPEHSHMSGSSPSSHYVGLRLRALIWSCLDCELINSAVFFAERYYCIDTTNHQARHLYASALLRAGHTHSALHIVHDLNCLGCVEVFSRCCTALGRFREGQEALDRCLKKGDASVTLGKCV
jgi:hypothetical protein